MMTAREAAFQTLCAYRRSGAWSDIYLRSITEKEQMDRRDISLAYRIAYGVLQNRMLIDQYISSFSSVKLKKMEDSVLDILRLSVYQIVFMDKVPANAAVNEAVKLAKKHCPNASGFINAVLRKIVSEKDKLPEIPDKDTVKFLSVKFSHPEWLVKYFISRIGADEAARLLEANNQIPPVFAHVNTLKADLEAVKEELVNSECVFSEHPWLRGCLELRLSGRLNSISAFQNGMIQIQDAAAKMAILAAGLREGSEVLDVCAAPGGKSFAAAALMNNKGHIISCDIYPQKVQEIENGAKRLGIDIIEAREADACVFNEEFCDRFDVVIADVPCSGIGIIRKKPEIRYKTEQDIAELPSIQKKILTNAASYVKPGGVLMYLTCTLMKSENEDVVSGFLSANSSFSAEKFTLPCPCGEAAGGMITLWPHIHGTDGFFICKLRRSDDIR